MEKENNLKLVKIRRRQRRVARGRSGKGGKTAGRGTKGAKARSGKATPAGFEGGQTPLIRRLPKRTGFRRKPRILKFTFNLDQIDKAFKVGETVSPQSLLKKGLVRIPKRKASQKFLVKILGKGTLSKRLKFDDCLFSESVKKILKL